MSKQDTIISLLKEIDKNIDNIGGGGSNNVNLEELTITNNGEYLPSEGVVGFSKVTAEFDTSSLPKVKVSRIEITNNNLLKSDQSWGEESRIDASYLLSFRFGIWNLRKIDLSSWTDTSRLENMKSAFDGNEGLKELIGIENLNTSNVKTMDSCFARNLHFDKHLNLSNWDVRKVTNFNEFFSRCYELPSIDLSRWETDSVTILTGMFYYCQSIKNIDIHHFKTEKVTSFKRIAAYCNELISIDITGFDASVATDLSLMFEKSPKLETFIGGKTIDYVIENNTYTMLNAKKPMDFHWNVNLDRASLRALINGLADLTGTDAKTLNLGATLIAKLTEEDIAIATAKNWTIA